MLFVPLARGATLLVVAFLVAQQLLGDGANTVYDINQVTLRQTITPDRLLGRMNAGMELAGHGVGLLLGALAGGVLGETIGLRGTLVVGGCCFLLSALWLALSPVRGLRDAPAPAGEAIARAVAEAG